MVLVTRQHKPACGIHMNRKSNSTNKASIAGICTSYLKIVKHGKLATDTKSHRKVGNKDAHEWRLGSIHDLLRWFGSQVIMHLNIETLEVITEICCKVDGGLSDIHKIIHCSVSWGNDSKVISIIFISLINVWQCLIISLEVVFLCASLDSLFLVHLGWMAKNVMVVLRTTVPNMSGQDRGSTSHRRILGRDVSASFLLV